jgi:hypothetical protein
MSWMQYGIMAVSCLKQQTIRHISVKLEKYYNYYYASLPLYYCVDGYENTSVLHTYPLPCFKNIYCILYYFHIQAVCKSKSQQLKSEFKQSHDYMEKESHSQFHNFFFFWRVRKAYFHRQVDSLLTKRVGRTQTIHTKCWSIECGECWESERIITTRTVKATSDDDEQCEKKNIQKN